jgi:hypothetical protein
MTVITAAIHPIIASAFNEIPNQSGFSGYLMAGGGYTKTASNMIVGTRTADLTKTTADSLTSAPGTNGSTSISVLGELRYTFAETKTQVAAGQVFTDYVRYDVTNLLGVRQETSKGTLGLSYVFSGFATQVWRDPYVVNARRTATDRDQQGFRLEWGRLLQSPVTFQYTYRNISLDERSGKTQLNLTEEAAGLLNRNADLHELQVSYERPLSERHTLVPELLYDIDDTAGKAMNARRYGVRMTHSYINKNIGVVLVSTASYTHADYEHVNPIYNETRQDHRYGLGLTYLQFGIFGRNRPQWALATNLFYFNEEANIEFYDTEIYGVVLSVMYRF